MSGRIGRTRCHTPRVMHSLQKLGYDSNYYCCNSTFAGMERNPHYSGCFPSKACWQAGNLPAKICILNCDRGSRGSSCSTNLYRIWTRIASVLRCTQFFSTLQQAYFFLAAYCDLLQKQALFFTLSLQLYHWMLPFLPSFQGSGRFSTQFLYWKFGFTWEQACPVQCASLPHKS